MNQLPDNTGKEAGLVERDCPYEELGPNIPKQRKFTIHLSTFTKTNRMFAKTCLEIWFCEIAGKSNDRNEQIYQLYACPRGDRKFATTFVEFRLEL